MRARLVTLSAQCGRGRPRVRATADVSLARRADARADG